MVGVGFVVIGGDVCNGVNFKEVSRTSSQKIRQRGNKPALFVPKKSIVYADVLEIKY